MKKIMFLAILSLCLFSCETLKIYQVNSTVVDYAAYSEKGFFISEATSVNFNYIPIGSIYVESISGYDISLEHSQQTTEYIFKEKEPGHTGKFIACNLNDAFKKLYETSIAKGANGVINVKMDYLRPFLNPDTKEIHASRWIVSGMMIKK